MKDQLLQSKTASDTNAVTIPSWILDTVTTLILLVSAALLAYQARLQVPWGQPLGSDYHAQWAEMFVLLISVAILGTRLAAMLSALSVTAAHLLGRTHPFREFVVILVLSATGILLMLPDVSQLQVIYYIAAGVVLGILCIALPRRLYPTFSFSDLLQTTQSVWKHRALLMLWLTFNIQTRYKQRVLGILWIVLLPVATSLVIAFAFSQFMQANIGVPFIAFYMSALVPYNFFSNNLYGSTNSVLGRVGIITQVYFPREILILLSLGETLVDFLFAFVALLIINVFFGVIPNVYFIYLPILFVILVLIVTGLMFLISALTVVVRDIPQFLSVALQLLFFLTPVIYPVEQFPDRFRFLFLINPVAPLVQGFRDVIAFGRPPDLISLCFPTVCAVIFLSVGYAVFKAFETEMTDLL